MEKVKNVIDAINEACWYLPKKQRDAIIEYVMGDQFDWEHSAVIDFLEAKFKCKIVR